MLDVTRSSTTCVGSSRSLTTWGWSGARGVAVQTKATPAVRKVVATRGRGHTDNVRTAVILLAPTWTAD